MVRIHEGACSCPACVPNKPYVGQQPASYNAAFWRAAEATAHALLAWQAGEISHGKLAELLGVDDKHTFKNILNGGRDG